MLCDRGADPRVRRIFCFLILALAIAPAAWPKSLELSPVAQQGLALVNNGHVLEALDLLRKQRQETPDDPTILFLLAMAKWQIMFLSTYDSKDRAELVSVMDRLESNCEPMIKKDDDALFFYSALQGLRAQLAGREGDWWKTAKLGKKMKNTAEDLIERNPDYQEAYYLLGSYNYFADALPGYIKFFRLLVFIPGGSRTEGLKQLAQAQEKGKLASIDAGRTLAYIYTFMENRPADGIRTCDLVLKSCPDAFDIGLYKGINLYFNSDFPGAQEWLSRVDSGIREYSRPHQSGKDGIVPVYAPVDREVLYWMARALILQKRMDEAEKILLELRTPEIHQPYWIQRGVCLSLARIAYSRNKKEQANALIRQVLSWQNVKEAHEKAKLLRTKENAIGAFEIDFR